MAKKQTSKKNQPATKKAASNAGEAKAAARKKVQKEVKLIPNQVYSFKANAKAKHLLDGQIYKISGEIASGLLSKGWGEIID